MMKNTMPIKTHDDRKMLIWPFQFLRGQQMELKTLKAIAKEQSLSIHTLRKFACQGMPHYRVGRRIFIDQQQFETWFAIHFRSNNDQNEDDLDKIVSDAISAIIK
jgi:hypothetical protein